MCKFFLWCSKSTHSHTWDELWKCLDLSIFHQISPCLCKSAENAKNSTNPPKIKQWCDLKFFLQVLFFHFSFLIIWWEWWSPKQFERRNWEEEGRFASSASSCKEKIGNTMPSQCPADLRHITSGRKQFKSACKLEVWEAVKSASNRL